MNRVLTILSHIPIFYKIFCEDCRFRTTPPKTYPKKIEKASNFIQLARTRCKFGKNFRLFNFEPFIGFLLREFSLTHTEIARLIPEIGWDQRDLGSKPVFRLGTFWLYHIKLRMEIGFVDWLVRSFDCQKLSGNFLPDNIYVPDLSEC